MSSFILNYCVTASNTSSPIVNWDYVATSQATTASYQNVVYYPQEVIWQQLYQYQTAQTVTASGNWNNFQFVLSESPEQRAIREEYEAKAAAAMKRAEDLLFLFLTAEQRSRYETEGCFETLVNDRLYRIRKGNAMNVDLMENGKAKFKYCVLPDNNPPSPDVMLAQLLLLESDEASFLALANRTVL